MDFIEPRKPTQNTYIKLFNRTYPVEILDAYIFDSIEEVLVNINECLKDKIGHLPHDKLVSIKLMLFYSCHSFS